MDITQGQKRILIITSIIAVLFIVFYVFVYLPAKDTVKRFKAELLQIENKINTTESIVGKDMPMEEGFSALQKQFKELNTKFPDNEKETLKAVSNVAYASGLNVISTKPQPRVLVLDKNKNPVKIGNRFCRKMTISMTIRSTYKDLGRFLEALRNDIPNLLTIERLKIRKGQEKDEIKTDINLTMHLLSE